MKKLNKIFRALIYILPAVLIFSYHPVILFGGSETMNFELSLPLLWLVVFDFVAVLVLVREKKLFNGLRRWWRGFLFPVFAVISLVWSGNVVRGILTCGILWLVVFAIYAILSLKEKFYNERGFYHNFLRFFFGSAIFVCAWCILQCVLDTFGVSREYTLLCQGCVYQMFGFPHPNGFAIEPQFMGNLLLAPTLVAAWLFIRRKSNKSERERSRGDNFYNRPVGAHTKLQFRDSLRGCCKNYAGSRSLCSDLLLFLLMATTLFLTFSRGAIYAFVVGVIFMSAMMLVRKIGFKRILVAWGVIILSFLFALNLQGILAQVSPTNDTYVSGVSKVLNHLSLGIIDVKTGTTDSPIDEDEPEPENEAVFDGYVEESTNIRTELTWSAVKVWSRDFRTILFGVGIGGAGQAMYDAGLTGTPKEIVQNEYASLLLETGLVGVLLVIFTLIMILKILRKNPVSIIILPLLVSYGVSLVFFSGLSNALQIYLLPPVLYKVLRKKLVS